ncbi:OmpP1/FadL family transporter [Sulfurivermis fontis]|uniref:OmpP1/FadL family transporter n=1 Tax=Sulfurivermis fontis TaxID=1972068 RepID=UPI000FDCD626|nr:outer membrane protein transport protein [Sulfurivermis fontis]
MKNSKRLLAASIAAACSTLPVAAFATNGDELIGLGAQSRALGGTGTAAFFGSENALTNPALLGKSKGTEFAFGGTVFMPDVKAESNFSGALASKTSDADQSVIPEVSMSTRINDNLTFGIGMYGTAGMGVDYRGNGGLIEGYTNLQLMKFAPTLAYNKDNFGFGFAPVLQYGALDINYKTDADGDGDIDTIGNGVSSDLGTGYNIGVYYDVNSQLTVALAYQSAISMTYKDQLTVAADGFGIGPNGMQTITSDKLEQPAQIKVGVAYAMDAWMFTADYKQIKWGSADGYKDFNWDDQNVYALGAKYTGNGYWVGVGYNHGEDPIKVLPSEQTMTGYSNQAVNMFNNHLFPGIVEDHITFGGGYAIGKNMMLEGAVVIADEITKTVNTGTISSVMGGFGPAGMPVDGTTHKVTHSQTSYTISLRMNF